MATVYFIDNVYQHRTKRLAQPGRNSASGPGSSSMLMSPNLPSLLEGRLKLF